MGRTGLGCTGRKFAFRGREHGVIARPIIDGWEDKLLPGILWRCLLTSQCEAQDYFLRNDVLRLES